MKRGITGLICVLLIAGILISPASAQMTNPPLDEPSPQVPHNKNNKFQEATALTAEFNETLQTSGRFIVQLMTPSLVAYDGGVPGIQKAPIDAQGKIIFNMSATLAYLKHVNNEIDRTINNASRAVGRDISKGVVFRYDTLFGGFAVEMTEKEARAIAQIEDVKAVYPDYIMWPQTDISPTWLGTNGIWDGTNFPGTGETQLMTKGEGVLVGILDTGINMDHPSFAAIGLDGYPHNNPFGSGVYKGLCATNPTNYICNDKLVGVYSYITTPNALLGEDDHSHGSHTASTVAGNALQAPYGGSVVDISGMAPHANIIAYDVCDVSGGCPDSAILAATQQALLDGVDVINFSIGPNAGPGQNPYSDPTELAFLEIVKAGGVVSTSAGNSGPNAMTTWKGAPWDITVANTGHGRSASDMADVLSQNSSRGPFTLLDVLEPEIAAPGTAILAAYYTSNPTPPYGSVDPANPAPVEVGLMSGTSMASPHVAGNAALLRALFPTWSGMEIKSALMMTAQADTTRDYNLSTYIDAFDYGNGRLDMTKAALTGLVMDEIYANMVAANPATGGDVKTLNIPSYQNSQCMRACNFTRTFKSVADVSATYTATVDTSTSALLGVTIEPSSFTIAPGETRSVTITIDVSQAPYEVFDFGRVTFATNAVFNSGEAISSVAIPLAVMPVADNIPDYVSFETHRDADSGTIPDLLASAITAGTTYESGLVKATLDTFVLDPDPTNGNPIDDLSQVFVKRLDVPAYSIRLVAEITATTASDLDMFLFWDADGDDVLDPSIDVWIDQSATGTAFEYINAPKGWTYYNLPDTYFLVVQNWGGAPGDTVTLATGVVPRSPAVGNYDVIVPETNPAGEPFQIGILWNVDTEGGDRLYGYFDTCADAACDEWIGATDLDIIRKADEIFLPLIFK